VNLRRTDGMEPVQQADSYLLTGCHVEPHVNNTFIPFNLGTSEQDVVPETEGSVLGASYHRSHSDLGHGEGSTSEHSTSVNQSVSKQSLLHCWLQSGPAQGLPKVTSEAQSSSHLTSEAQSLTRSSSLFASGDAEVAKSEDRDYGAAGSRAPPTPGSNSEPALGLPEGITSIGALGHDTNTCKPCAWNWKPSGCVNGRSCDFCHLCERGELNRRRKEHVAVLRKSEKENKQKIAKARAAEEGRIGAAEGSGLDSGSVFTAALSGHENASSTSKSALTGFASSESQGCPSSALAEATVPASSRHYPLSVPATHLMAKNIKLISL